VLYSDASNIRHITASSPWPPEMLEVSKFSPRGPNCWAAYVSGTLTFFTGELPDSYN